MFGKKNEAGKGIKINVELRDSDAIEAKSLAFSKLERVASIVGPMLLGAAGLEYISIQAYNWGVALDNALGKMPLVSESANQGAKVIAANVMAIFNASSIMAGIGEGMIISATGVGVYYAGTAALRYLATMPKKISAGAIKLEKRPSES
ncbi:MAG: hypothetical protein KGH54_03580 [Candidatus Micrarchaeota archaeon]|nr:hypothetical protein [Candidatus Micrarchaeota archaeon]